MKQFLILFISLFITLERISAQSEQVHGTLLLVDSLIKNKNYHETGLRILVKNTGEGDIYIPKMMDFFYAQIRDSLYISKLENGVYKVVSFESGAKVENRPAPFYGMTTHLMNSYHKLFVKKKKFGDSLVTRYASTNPNRGSANALFLSKGETFILYQISPVDYLFKNEGDYCVTFKLNSKAETPLPEDISGYRKYTFKEILVSPLYISVRFIKKGSKVILKDSNKKVIASFIWKFKRYD